MGLTKKQENKNLILTLIQYLTLVAFMLISPLKATGLFAFFVELLGVVLGVWAIVVMNGSKIHIMPKPRSGAILIRKGPYHLIRHPMYAAIILTLTPLIITHFDWWRLGTLMVLYINLIFKLTFEESLLMEFFDDYAAYRKKTWRLLPYVF